jgi:hypothetical protein
MAALTCTLFVAAIPVLGAVTENQNLKDVISQYHDAQMTVEDLAFFLATHNFNATPKVCYVQITIGSTIYKVVPNSETGLAEISIMN